MIRDRRSHINAIADREYVAPPPATRIERIQVSLDGGRWTVTTSGQQYQEVERRPMRGSLFDALAWLDERGERLAVFPGQLYNFTLNEPIPLEVSDV